MPKPRPDVLVRAKGLAVGYGHEPVCGPATFMVRPGDVLAVVGANGTGKSTLLRSVLGLLPVLGGSLQVLGSEVDERSLTFRRSVASVLDDDAFFPALTVAEHLVLTARGHGVADPAGLVAGVLHDFGLTDRATALPTALSSGQRRRLLLAAAFARPRRLLVLDEPEQRLDAGMRDRLGKRIVAERQARGSVVVASHDPSLVRRVATKGLLVGEDATQTLTADEAATAIEEL